GWRPRSSPEPSAVDGQGDSGDVIRRARGEENGRASEVAGGAPAARRDSLEDGARAVRVILKRPRVVGRDIARRYGVHRDALAQPLVGEGFGEPGYPGFRRRVSGHIDAALEAEERGGEDDLAVAACDHGPAHSLGEDELAREVDADHPVAELEGMFGRRRTLDGAGIVDKDVDGHPGQFLTERDHRGAIGEVDRESGELSSVTD